MNDLLRLRSVKLKTFGCIVLCLLALPGIGRAQSISSLQPASCQPGVPTKLTLRGAKLPKELRVIAARADARVEIESVSDVEAVLTVSLPSDARLGSLGLWFATSTGPLSTKIMMVDDLPTVLDNGKNHSLASAQDVSALNAIDGVSDGPKLDHYRLKVAEGQRVAFEVLTQPIHSKMDPVLRLLGKDGSVLKVADDDSTGPDCRFSYKFSDAGEYFVQVSDSHYAAGGEYHLRIGDFPIVDRVFPLAVHPKDTASLRFVGPDSSTIESQKVNVGASAGEDSVDVATRFSEGKSHAWSKVVVSELPQLVEPAESGRPSETFKNTIDVPTGISGRLENVGEQDSYWMRGVKGQSIRFSSKTRSLGCATLLRMELYNVAGAKVAETPVNDSDEWSFDYTIPEDGEYRLAVSDLLHRGGRAFGYWIEVVPASRIAVAIKPEPKARRSFAVEEKHGGFAIDLQVSRFGYEGEIDLSIAGVESGLRILNPRIAAGAKEHRAILLANEHWLPQSFQWVKLHARGVGSAAIACDVSSQALDRVQEPHVLSPDNSHNGVFAAAGTKKSESLFTLEPQSPILLDRTVQTHSVQVRLKRLKDKFKAGVTVHGDLVDPLWTVIAKADNDQLSLTIKRPVADSTQPAREPDKLSLLVYSELPDRVRHETISIPITWIDPPGRLESYPKSIELVGATAEQQIAIAGNDANGQMRDWTQLASLVSTNPAVVKVRDRTVVPVSNGEATIVAQIGEAQCSIPVKVLNFESSRPVAFESEVLVALSKQGCNSGACHGSPSGKGNFRLSLRAFDKALDELTLIREDYGRRVNPIDPDQSLLLLKPMMKVTHGGGKQLRKDDDAFRILRKWIAEGAKTDTAGTARCVKLEVYPNQKRILKRSHGTQQLVATACFADGQKRDVTRLVAYESTNTEVATVDKHGLVTPHARGETVILLRYLEHIESIPLMFIDEVPGFEWSEPSPKNYIDELVQAKLKQLQYLPAPVCSDSTFLRRVYLDVIGLLPTVEETKEFLADSDDDKRSKVIDRLLVRDEFAKFWALKWGDLLRLNSKSVGIDGVYKYHRWVEEAIRSNMAYDEFARELLTASGSTLVNPTANFYRTSNDMNECVETVSQVFLGSRLQCAKCHNHPFERWTQDNYYGLGAFFNRLQRKTTLRPGEMFVWTSSTGEVTQPRTGEVMKPWLPQTGSVDAGTADDRRPIFVKWLVDSENPYFAKIEANRIWSQFFSRGIVDPIDDFRDSNPPSNESLLEALAKDFSGNGFDRKRLIRTILNSKTYQASSQTSDWNAGDKIYFSHQTPRMISAEQLLDAINHVAGLRQTFAGLPEDMKATQLPAPDVAKNAFLKIFGQPERSTVCACERTDDSNLGMAIELFNGPLVYEKLRDANHRFRKLHAEGCSTQEIVTELYLAALCRPPSEAELATSLQHCQSREDILSGFEDLCWVLINTDEFLFQH